MNTNDSGAGTLRQAITDANANVGADIITFSITNAGKSIGLASALPTITEAVTIDGTTQPGYGSAPLVELVGTSAGNGVDGLKILTSNTLIRALCINRFNSNGVTIASYGSNAVEGCWIGLGLDGTTVRANSQNGILITNSANNTIGDTTAAARNFVSGNTLTGVHIGGSTATNNTILGNVIGLGSNNVAKANAVYGVRLNAPGNLVGGTAAAARNVISGNTGNGIEVTVLGVGNIIQGNYIGTDLTGAADLGNTLDGILLNGAASNTIGGTVSGAGNVISGNNSDGIEISYSTAGPAFNTIQGNVIGLNALVTAGVGNSAHGINLGGFARTNTIGGVNAGEANTIAFNGSDGVYIYHGTAANYPSNNTVRVNSIYANGTAAGDLGIDLGTSGVTANDTGDGDNGPNQSQNFPVLTAATNFGSSVVIAGTLNSRPSLSYWIDFYANQQSDTSGSGEGQFYLGTTNITTDGSGNASFTATLSVTPQGRYITATATDATGNTSEFATNVVAVSTVSPTTFTVVNTNDSGVGSLRQAILDANAYISTGPDTIAFGISGAGPHTIAPAYALPELVEGVTIDGYTQPGAGQNTLASGFDAVLKIRLVGTNAGSGTDGLRLISTNNTVRGLVIIGFNGDGIEVTAGSNVITGNLIGVDLDGSDQGNGANGVLITTAANNVLGDSAPSARNIISGNASDGIEINGAGATNNLVQGNFIGTDPFGTNDVGNTADGIYVTAAAFNTIGGSSSGAGNVISGNNSDGIEINGAGSSNNVVQGNFIGTTVTGTAALGNTTHGVYFSTSAKISTVGGTGVGEANTIAFNGADGVSIASAAASTNIVIRANSIFSNGDLGIDLLNDGITANDAGDSDAGSNQKQNFPILTAATNNSTNTIIVGSLNSKASTNFTLDFYSSYTNDTLGCGEGQFYLGSTNVTTDASGNVAFLAVLPVFALGRAISATATDSYGNTSEFATNVTAVSTVSPTTFTVINTNDSGTGSLRQAIIDVNIRHAGTPNTIFFNIPGAGLQVIKLASALPTIYEPVIIDGYTQPGAVANSSALVFNGTILIQLNGTNLPSGSDGLHFAFGSNTVRGLDLVNFKGDAIELTYGVGSVIEGNIIGLSTANQNWRNGNGVYISGSSGNTIGGTNVASRNVITGNDTGVQITSLASFGNQVLGNLIGLDANGTNGALGYYGVQITTALANTVGGSAPGARNVLSSHYYDGVFINYSTNNSVLGNYIGTDPSGTLDLGNSRDGVLVQDSSYNLIGGTTVGTGNLISGNNAHGVMLQSAGTGNQVLGNHIGTDVTGTNALPNTYYGVQVISPGNAIGGVAAGAGNVVAFNGLDGVMVDWATAMSATNNAIRGNSIFQNGGLGIDLVGTDGVNTNDVNDTDTGANLLQNYPILTAATNTATNVVIAGTLNSRSNALFQLDFFSSPTNDPSGFGEGQTYLGSGTVTTDATSNGIFLVTLPVPVAGRFITATATDPNGNTSEFSQAIRSVSFIPPATFTVINTNDSGPGSLRQALLDAAPLVAATPNTIQFNIPGAGVQRIMLQTPLPLIAEPVILDGYTQPGSAVNSSPLLFNATILIQINGTNLPSGSDGLCLFGERNTLRGLELVNFKGDAIELLSGSGSVIEGNIIGLSPTGTDWGNGNGVNISGSAGNTIGGTNVASRNVISGNATAGVLIGSAASTGNQVLGNLIGLTLNGASGPVGNYGVQISAAHTNTIGGTVAGARNVISANSSHGVYITGSSINNSVLGNYIGTDPNGTADLGNSTDGVRVYQSSFNVIGGTETGAGNLISGNNNDGVNLNSSGTGNQVLGNRIGTDVTGTTALGNTTYGVEVGTAGNTIGGTAAGAANLIAFNGTDGVYVTGTTSTNNAIRGNAIFHNGGLGIDLYGTDGVNTNDVNDTDTGPNLLQNYPILTAATNTATNTVIAGTLNSRSNALFQLDFFCNLTNDPSGFGEGQTYLGSGTVTTDSTSNGTFLVTLPVAATGRRITATATDPDGNTSEFSQTITSISFVEPATFTVINANDSGPGSLRQAILDAVPRAAASPNTIAFNIPGAGLQRITLQTPLAPIYDPVIIDGYTQPGSATNSSSLAFNGTILIQLNGTNLTSSSDGLRFTTGNNTVRGLDIVNFPGDGIEFASGSGSVVEGCIIGLSPANQDWGNGYFGINISGSAGNTIGGTNVASRNVISGNASANIQIISAASSGNQVLGNLIGPDLNGALGPVGYYGVQIITAHTNVIGGTAEGARNVISANFYSGVLLSNSATNNSVLGNYIGTDPTGLLDLGNVVYEGVRIEANSSFNIIGGTAAGVGNLISGNGADGVIVSSGMGNQILGNWIGTDVTGTNALSNAGAGVDLGSSWNNTVGGLAAGAANLIAFNASDGVYVSGSSATNNSVRRNSIFGNTGLGIDLFGSNGVNANDTGDSDTGPNGLQNFPILTTVTNNLADTLVAGTLNSATNATFALDFYATASADPTGYGEGQLYLGSTNVTTDGSGNATFTVTLGTANPWRYVCATATSTNGSTSEFGPVFSAYSTLPGSNFVVTTTNDSGAGSLRQAILDANACLTSGDTISFNIPGAGLQTIRPASALPPILDRVTIDGYTQPGASANTLTNGFDANLLVRLDGASAGSGVDGLRLASGYSLVRGLIIQRFASDGIEIATNGASVVEGCLIQSNLANGVLVNATPGNRIGGTTPAARNVISANSSDGIELNGTGASGNLVQGNFIGTDPGGTMALANSSYGVSVTASGNTVGGTADGAGNVIAFNGADGVNVSGATTTNNAIRGNAIFFNDGLGIDLVGANGVNANDANDTDTGANLLQNFPVLSSATNALAATEVRGSLNSLPNTTFALDFYASFAADTTGQGEGQQYLGATNVTTDGSGNVTFVASVRGGILVGRQITATATDPFGNTSEFSLALGIVSTVPGATFVVTTTNDSGAGSLRQAILTNETTFTSGNTIAFNIPGPGPHTIAPLSLYPNVSNRNTTIDGYTQPGASPNTLTNGDDAVIKIILDGTHITDSGHDDPCFMVYGPYFALRGLSLARFIDPPVELQGTASNSVVQGNFIGLYPDGLTAWGSLYAGVWVVRARNVLIGGPNPADRNLIAGNANGVQLIECVNATVQGNYFGTDRSGAARLYSSYGVYLDGATNSLIGGTLPGAGNLIAGGEQYGVELMGADCRTNRIYGNMIGTDFTGTNGLGFGLAGVHSYQTVANIIGGPGAGEGNVIAFNGRDGVYIESGTNNAVRGNAIFSNTGLAIDLGTDGVTANDANDTDTGANQLQNFPVLTAATNSLGGTEVRGSLNSLASATFALDFFANAAADPTGYGEGRVFLGSTNVTTDGSGNVSFTATVLGGLLQGRYITATATDPNGNTSEFSLALAAVSTLPGSNYVVTTTNDSGPGSLRQAINDANAVITAGDTISFNIPGPGPHTIAPLTLLSNVYDPGTTIDGYTQSGARPNTLANGDDAVILIKIDGTNIVGSGYHYGLRFWGRNGTARGLSIVTFPNGCIEIYTNAADCVVEGNFLGVNPDGVTPNGTLFQGITVNLSDRARIGGTTPAARNLISGNAGSGVLLNYSQGAVIQGNFIGTDRTGTLDLGNTIYGVSILGSSNNLIGGSVPGAGNLISGSHFNGIHLNLTNAVNNIIQGNLIGTDVTGTNAIPNQFHGIQVISARFNLIGGTNAGEGNVIGFSGQDGVYVQSGTNNAIRCNAIFNNGDQAIDLSPSGVTVNDANDADTGANQLQNFPLLTAATAHTNRTDVSGTLNSTPSTTFQLDFFSTYTPDTGGNGEGRRCLGSTNVTTDGSGNATFSATLPRAVIGRYICATATDPHGNTSEMGPCFKAASTIPPVTYVVTTTNDFGNGSLRQIILAHNLTVSATPNPITFNIPNPGPHTIALTSALPAFTEAALLDGYTQPNASANTLAAGNDAVLMIRLDGVNAGTTADGLRLQDSNNVVRGLCIVRFGDNGLNITAASNRVEGCFLGIDLNGSDQGNTDNGVYINGGANNVIGGITPAARNVISGNNSDGLEITGAAARGNLVIGNFIGTGLAGIGDVGNSSYGMLVYSASNTIGGASASVRNIISGNNGSGVMINDVGASNNLVQGNFIGTDVSGSAALANSSYGVYLYGAPRNTIGGTGAGQGNVISGNANAGVAFINASAAYNTVAGNLIGLDASGLLARANASYGVFMGTSSHDNTIGPGNTIAYNADDGVYFSDGTNNAIRANNIFRNTGLGIDLYPNGVTANDPGDVDTGVNFRQNFPVILAATNSATNIVITGTMNSKASTTFTLDFFANTKSTDPAVDEAEQYLGSGTVTTDAMSNGTFIVTQAVAVVGRYITATATDPFGNTSELAPPVPSVSLIPPVTFVVTNTDDSGPGSLRQAILNNNAAVSATNNTISFNIAGAGPHTITPLSVLPTIYEPATIDGYTQPGASANTLAEGDDAVIKIRLSGQSAGNTAGLLFAADHCAVRGLAIGQFVASGVQVTSGTGCCIDGCFIGLDVDGSTPLGNYDGIYLPSTAVSNTVIGGATPAARNVISGNRRYGIYDNTAPGTLIQGNFIGTDASGTLCRGNTNNGIYVYLTSLPPVVIGGATSAARNVISGNGSYTWDSASSGIQLYACAFTVVQGNRIGTDVTGTLPLGNRYSGVYLYSYGTNTIGGIAPGAGNLISGNSYGVYATTSPSGNGDVIQGNLIGTDVKGTSLLGSQYYGLYFDTFHRSLIGGSVAGAGNVIAGSQYDGIFLSYSTSSSNTIQGNWIGTDPSGTLDLGNGRAGIYIISAATLVGGESPGMGNVIAFNRSLGVTVSSFTGNAILGNSIHDNGGLGIDLDVNGVNFNDSGDSDTGANNLQNFPVLAQAVTDTNTTCVMGTFNSISNAQYRLEFFDNTALNPSGYGEGKAYVGFTNVTTDAAGNATFLAWLNPAPATLRQITATATAANGDTSEFSTGRMVVPYDSTDLRVSIAESADPASVVLGFSYTITVTNAGPTNATSVFVTNTLTGLATIANAIPSQGSCSIVGDTVIADLGTLAVGAVATVNVAMQPTADGDITSSALVVAAQADYFPADNIAFESTWAGLADLAVYLVDSTDPTIAGQVLTFTATVTNFGPDPATFAQANFTLPVDFVLTSATVSQGSYSDYGSALVAEFGTIMPGGYATLAVSGVFIGTGSYSSDASCWRAEADPNSRNDTAYQDTEVQEGPGIVVFDVPSVSVAENVGTANLMLNRLGGAIGAVTVEFVTLNGTALGGSDFVPMTNTVNFADGQTFAVVSVPIINDNQIECSETFYGELRNPTGGAVLVIRTNISVEIINNDFTTSGVLAAATRADPSLPPVAGNNDSGWPAISRDGRWVAFNSYANNLVTNDSNGQQDVFLRDLLNDTTLLVSQTSDGRAANSYSEYPVVSMDGRFVAFQSYASNLAPLDNNDGTDVFVRDMTAGTNILVSVNAAGTGSGNSYSDDALISSNGQVVVFGSYASDLTTNVFTGNYNVFARDWVVGVTRLVSVSTNGVDGGNGESTLERLTPDGRFVAFFSGASDLVTNDANGFWDVFVRDLASNVTHLVSVGLTGQSGTGGGSAAPFLSADGRCVAFESQADNLVAQGYSAYNQVFHRDLVAGTTMLISLNSAGTGYGDNHSYVRGISEDGRYVLFEGQASNLVTNDSNGAVTDAFVRDTWSNTTVLVSINQDGTGSGSHSSWPRAISADGRYVYFESQATNLTAGKTSRYDGDVFVRDLQSGTTTLISASPDTGLAGDNDSYTPVISADGTVVAFLSDASNLTPYHNRYVTDVLARTLAGSVELVSAGISTTAKGYSYTPVPSADGRFVAYTSDAGNLVPNDHNETEDAFLYDVLNGTNILVSVSLDGVHSADNWSYNPVPSGDGRYVAFLSEASDLFPLGGNYYDQLYLRATVAGTNDLITINYLGTALANSYSDSPVITPSGSHVLYRSQASDLVANDTNGRRDLFLWNRGTRSNVLVTADWTGTNVSNGGDHSDYTISDDGRFVAFASYAANLHPLDTNFSVDVFLRDMQAGTNLLLSINASHTGPGASGSQYPWVTPDGRFVLFSSYADDLVAGDANQSMDVFLYDRFTGTNELISFNQAGTSSAAGQSWGDAITPDGRYVLFSSTASDIAPNDNNGAYDVFVRDRVSGTTRLVSWNCPGTGPGNAYSYGVSISSDGRYVSFESEATDLVSGQYGAWHQNAFRRDLLTGTTEMLSRATDGVSGGNDYSYWPLMSTNGQTVAFESYATDLISGDNNANTDIFVWHSTGPAANLPPVVVSETLLATQNVARVFSALPGGELLANDSDPEGHTLSILAVFGEMVSFTNDFNSDLPLGTSTNGNAVVDSGVLKLTEAAFTQTGWFNISNLAPGKAIAAFTATFKVLLTSGSANPADGFSFNFTPALPAGTWPGNVPEEGLPTGLSVCFDNYDNGGGEAPAIDVFWNGSLVSSTNMPLMQSANWLNVAITLHADGTLDVLLDGTSVFAHLPTGYTPTEGGFVLGARTGIEYETHYVDDLTLVAYTLHTAQGNTAIGGTVTLTNTSIYYTPPTGFSGTDSFYYVVSDGQPGGTTIDIAYVDVWNPASGLTVTGQVAMAHYVGPAHNGMGTRTVSFNATDNGGTVLQTWTPSLNFTPGPDGYGVASYTLTGVPLATTRLNTKTAWTLREQLTLAFNGVVAEADFTGASALRGGDLDGSNFVDIFDYFILAAAWYSANSAADIDGSGRVDLDDYFLLGNSWYEQGNPP